MVGSTLCILKSGFSENVRPKFKHVSADASMKVEPAFIYAPVSSCNLLCLEFVLRFMSSNMWAIPTFSQHCITGWLHWPWAKSPACLDYRHIAPQYARPKSHYRTSFGRSCIARWIMEQLSWNFYQHFLFGRATYPENFISFRCSMVKILRFEIGERTFETPYIYLQ